MRALACSFAMALLVGATAAGAQARFDPAEGFRPEISDETVAGLSSMVMNSFAALRCGDQPCQPVTEAERNAGLVSTDDAREVIRRGMLSQVAECAGVDWQRQSFLPMMAEWRQRRKATTRQLAFVGALHGVSMGMVLRQLGGECPKNRDS
jgi:hypothetical protein